jgi:hypothetical protein
MTHAPFQQNVLSEFASIPVFRRNEEESFADAGHATFRVACRLRMSSY